LRKTPIFSQKIVITRNENVLSIASPVVKKIEIISQMAPHQSLEILDAIGERAQAEVAAGGRVVVLGLGPGDALVGDHGLGADGERLRDDPAQELGQPVVRQVVLRHLQACQEFLNNFLFQFCTFY
jgi:hypothetical protein